MNLRLFLAIVLLEMVSARFGGFRPKFFGLDSAVIVDTDKSVPVVATQKLPPQNRNPQYFRRLHYPFYQIIPRAQKLSKTTEAPLPISSTSSTTPVTIYTKDEFPADLVDIAQNKLGIKSLEEIPSVSELGYLLGTQSAEETIKYIRELTATEEGIELVKAYIESTDYTDSTGTGSSSTSTLATVPIDSTIDNMAQPSFFKRMSDYLNFFDLFATTAIKNKEIANNSLQQLDRFTAQGKHQQPVAINNMVSFKANSAHKPLLVRHPLPYHYPIPIRPMVIYQPRGAAAHAMQSVVHLNTPKMLMPTVQMARKSTNLSMKKTAMPKQQRQQQQQLNDLAARVSKFPLTHNRDALIDAQYVAAIEKAFAEDEDLKKILGSTETLK